MFSRLFATTYDRLSASAERATFAPLRRDLLAPLSGSVLEIGAGTGANFAYYPDAATVLAVEPNPEMRRRAAAKAASAPATITIVEGKADALPADDASQDAVVSTLVLCSVPDQARALAELRRVLRPGGVALFIEHVRAEQPGWLLLQRLWEPPQRLLADNCHLTRDTVGAIRSAGFAVHRVAEHGGGVLPIRVVHAAH